MPGYADVIDLARRANVAVHFIDPRGLETGIDAAATPTGIGPPDPSVMPGTALALPALETEGIAQVTGGHVFGASDPGKALRRVATETDAYYLLGYSPEVPRNGERRVEVRTRREGLKIVARSRYFVSDPAAKPRARDAAPSPAHAAMRSLADVTELPLRVSTLFFEANKKGEVATMLATEVVPRPGKSGERLFKLVSEARAARRRAAGARRVRGLARGRRPALPSSSPASGTFRPGVWQVRLLVEDTASRPHRHHAAHVRGPRPEGLPDVDADPHRRDRGPRREKEAEGRPRPHLPHGGDALLPVQRVRSGDSRKARLGAPRHRRVDAPSGGRGRPRGPAHPDPARRATGGSPAPSGSPSRARSRASTRSPSP